MSLADKVFSYLFGCVLKPVADCNAALKMLDLVSAEIQQGKKCLLN